MARQQRHLIGSTDGRFCGSGVRQWRAIASNRVQQLLAGALLGAGVDSDLPVAVDRDRRVRQPKTSASGGRYGWLGVHQRDTNTVGGMVLMGGRLYNPTTGRFLSIDPVEGGNDNRYTYTRSSNCW
jgi:RHS repeat-associated protein